MTEVEDARECWEQARDALCEISKDIPTSVVPTSNPRSLAAAAAFQRWWRLKFGASPVLRGQEAKGNRNAKPRSPWP